MPITIFINFNSCLHSYITEYLESVLSSNKGNSTLEEFLNFEDGDSVDDFMEMEIGIDLNQGISVHSSNFIEDYVASAVCVHEPLDCIHTNETKKWSLMVVSNVTFIPLHHRQVGEIETQQKGEVEEGRSARSDLDPLLQCLMNLLELENPPLVHSIGFSTSEDEVAPSYRVMFDTIAKKLLTQGVTLIAAAGSMAPVVPRQMDDHARKYEECNMDASSLWPGSSPYVLTVGYSSPAGGDRIEQWECSGDVGHNDEEDRAHLEGCQSARAGKNTGFDSHCPRPQWHGNVTIQNCDQPRRCREGGSDERPGGDPGCGVSINRRRRAYPDVSVSIGA